jgi:EpsI family protein
MNTTIRLLIVAMLVGLLAASTYVFPAWLSPKRIELPDWSVSAVPDQLETESGLWRGAEVEVAPDVMEWLLRDADDTVDWEYADEKNNVVSLHMAFFSKLDDGIRHSPFNCYRGQGWRELDRRRLMLAVSDKASIPVSLSTWEREGEKVMVMYWYQLDEYILFNRWELGVARWKLRNKETWPAMVKVLLQTSAADPDKGREQIQTVARKAYEWLNQPAHRASSARPNG